jgi:hypothetical protein
MICDRCHQKIKQYHPVTRYDNRLYHDECLKILRSLHQISEPRSHIASVIDWDELEFDFTSNPDPRPLLERLRQEIEDMELRSRFNVAGSVSMYLYMVEPPIDVPEVELPTALPDGQISRKTW